MKTIEEKDAIDGSEDYTQDGTVDLKGRPILRSKTGQWKGSSFIIGYEVFERIAYHGISANLFIFFTKKLNYGTVDASNIVTNWVGTTWMLPILSAYIADAHLGRFWTFLISLGFYIPGMILLALVATNDKLLMPKPMCASQTKDQKCPPHIFNYREVCLFGALYLIAIGDGGTKPNISSMGADQFDDFEPKEKKQKTSFFNWWMFTVFFGGFLATTLMVWIQERKGFDIGYSIQALLIVLGLILFLTGTRFYRHKKPSGSAFTKIGRVLVASFKKWNVHIPENAEELHELSLEEYTRDEKFRIDHTPSLRFLDKAAVKTGPNSSWMQCTVTQVEETKQMMKMIPILLSSIIPSTLFGAVQTLFVKQATTLDLKLFPNTNPIPPSSLKCMINIFMILSVILYDRFFVPYMRRHTKNPRGITMLTRMGVGMALYVAIATAAYFAELKRMAVIKESGIYNPKVNLPISFVILIPQFALVGIADTFLEVAKMDFFYDQAPSGMKSLGTSYYSTSIGIGCFLNSFILRTISNLTESKGNPGGWVPDYNLNVGHLDYYYALYILLTSLNFIFFLVVAKLYVYNVDTEKSKKNESEMAEMETVSATEIRNLSDY